MESALQRKIVRWFEKQGFYPVKIINSSKTGFPDLMILDEHGQAPIFIEVKDKNKKARPLQVYRHKELRDRKYHVHVFDTWEAFAEYFVIK